MKAPLLPTSALTDDIDSPQRGGFFTGLPQVPTTPFVGREAALADVRGLLAEQRTRLLTLTGPGGTGKTRLALELAAELRSTVARSAFVDLTAASEPRQVAALIAQTLSVDTSSTRLLAEVLAGVPTLLILDTFEHVVSAATFVADLLGACPDLVIIATSREALGIRAEHVYPIEPLPLPDLAGRLDDSTRFLPSIRLFAERARARQTRFQLTDEVLPLVAEICVRLDGLPLAIELAAAQMSVLSPAAILKRLTRGTPLLGMLHRDLPPRQQTLDAAVAWSYELLDPSERHVFRWSAVFDGGFNAEALEEVLAATNVDLLMVLAQLVSKSLIRVENSDGGEPRFSLLRTIRQFAVGQLQRRGEWDSARARHAEYFVALAEGLEPEITGPRPAGALDAVGRDYGNFRAVLQWSATRDQPTTGVRLAVALYRYWQARGPVAEARAWLDAILPRSGAVPPVLRAAALNAAGVLAALQADNAAAETAFGQSLALWQELDEPGAEAGVCLNLGLVAHVTGRPRQAEDYFGRASSLFGTVGDERGQGRALASRARLAREEGDLPGARRLAEQALMLFRSAGDDWGSAHQLVNLGHLDLAVGDRAAALSAFRQGLSAWRSVGNIVELAECLEGIAGARAERQPRQAARLLGAADALRQQSGAAIAAVEQSRYQAVLDRVRAHIRADTFVSSWQAGRALSLEEAIDAALADDSPDSGGDSVLSPRETEIARLVARGYSNNGIADELVLSVKTVETHVQHIFRKLHVKRRAAIGAWAARRDLL